MKSLSAVSSLLLIIVLGASVVASQSNAPSDAQVANPPPNATDPIVASFERELNHVPAPSTPPLREAIDQDILYRTINRATWSSAPGRSDESDDIEITEGDGNEES